MQKNITARRGLRAINTAVYVCGFIALLALILFLGFYKLGDVPLESYDESRHGVNAYEMLQTGDCLTTTYQYEPDAYNAKPPLSEWIIALNYKLFGASAFSLRMYSVLSFALCAAIVALYVWRRFGMLESLFVLLLAAALPTKLLTLDHYFRYGDADMLYMLFFTVSMLFMLEARRGVRMYYGCAAFFVLAFLTKGPHAFVIPAICLANACLTGDIKRLKIRNYLMFVLIGIVPIAAWAVARLLRDGGAAFFSTMINNDLGRAFKTVENQNGGFFYYLSFAENLFPATIGCAGIAALTLVRQKRFLPGRNGCGMLSWLLVLTIAYSVSRSKCPWYIYPATFALILPAAVFFGRMTLRAPKRLPAAVITIMIVLFCADTVKDTATEIMGYVPAERTGVELALDAAEAAGVDKARTLYIESEYTRSDKTKNADNLPQSGVLQLYFDGWTHATDGGAKAFFASDDENAVLLIERGLISEYDALANGYACIDAGEAYALYARS